MALERVSTIGGEKELIDLAPSRVSLIRKVEGVKIVNIDEIEVLSTQWGAKDFYLWYSERRAFLWSNNGLLENFFKIYQGRWKYEPEKQVFNWWMNFNGIESI